MRSGLFASVLLYLVAFGVSLLLKTAIDQVEVISKYAPWAYTISLPVFGVFQIVAKSQITLWFEDFIKLVDQHQRFNFKRFVIFSEHFLILIETILLLPVRSGILLFNSLLVIGYFIAFAGACFGFFSIIWMTLLFCLRQQQNIVVLAIFFIFITIYSIYFGFKCAREKYYEIKYFSSKSPLNNYGVVNY